MAAAFGPDHAYRIDADGLGFHRIFHRRHLMDHLNPGALQLRQISLRVAARGFDERDVFLNDQIEDFLGLFAFHQLGQHGDVDPERLAAGQVAATADFITQRRNFGEARRRNEPHDARVDGSGHIVGVGQPLQTTRQDRHANAQKIGNFGFHGDAPASYFLTCFMQAI